MKANRRNLEMARGDETYQRRGLQPDEERAFRICEALAERADARGIEALSPIERVPLLAWWVKGLVDNGGFFYFYEGAHQASEAGDAFDALELPEAAAAVRASMAVFPEGVVPLPQQERWERLHTLSDEEREAFFRPLDDVIMDLHPALFAALNRYFDRHAEEFLVPR